LNQAARCASSPSPVSEIEGGLSSYGTMASGVDAGALGIAVILHDEHCNLAFTGPGGGHVSVLHRIQCLWK